MVRLAQLSGKFYPQKVNVLSQVIDIELENAFKNSPLKHENTSEIPSPKAIIVPHAGYDFCLKIACQSYIRIKYSKRNINKIVIIGPSHYVGFNGLALPESSIFKMPLGEVKVNLEIVENLIKKFPFITKNEQIHLPEHSLEVHLPILQKIFDNQFSIIPLITGICSAQDLSNVYSYLNDEQTLFVISTDMSHFLEYTKAKILDNETKKLIETYNYHRLKSHNLCGYVAVNGFLHYAQKQAMRISSIALNNSFDTSSINKDRVVGYGSWICEEQDKAYTFKLYRNLLLKASAQAIVHYVKNKKKIDVGWNTIPYELQSIRATFVTLKKNNSLRGCIGSLYSNKALVENVIENSINASFNDPRFTNVELAELQYLEIEVSILSSISEIIFNDELDLLNKIKENKDGLIIQDGKYSGTFLPSVWESIKDKKQFLQHLKQKATLPIDYWSDTIKVFRYNTEKFSCSLINALKF